MLLLLLAYHVIMLSCYVVIWLCCLMLTVCLHYMIQLNPIPNFRPCVCEAHAEESMRESVRAVLPVFARWDEERAAAVLIEAEHSRQVVIDDRDLARLANGARSRKLDLERSGTEDGALKPIDNTSNVNTQMIG